jgi:hypothetical protein
LKNTNSVPGAARLEGVVYLVHFDSPLSHARHYVGFCEREDGLDSRFEYHAKGRGSRLLAALTKAGGKFTLVRLWRGTRNDERALKRRKNTPAYCPRCAEKPYRFGGLEELTI